MEMSTVDLNNRLKELELMLEESGTRHTTRIERLQTDIKGLGSLMEGMASLTEKAHGKLVYRRFQRSRKRDFLRSHSFGSWKEAQSQNSCDGVPAGQEMAS